MNSHIALEITNEILVTKNFNIACQLAAKKDDGKIDKEEQKILNQITKASERYINELNKIYQKNK